MNPLKILLMGSKELAALNLSEASQILIYVVYGAIILAFAGAFVRVYKEFGLGKIVQAIREGRDPVKEKSFNRDTCKACKGIKNIEFEAWLEEEKGTASDTMYRLIEDKRYDLAELRGKRADIFREVLLKYRELTR